MFEATIHLTSRVTGNIASTPVIDLGDFLSIHRNSFSLTGDVPVDGDGKPDLTGLQRYTEIWGSLKLLANGVDITEYRGHPTRIESFVNAEPFSDRSMQVTIPGVTIFDNLEDLPFNEDDNIDLWRVNQNGDTISPPIWEGYIDSLGRADDGGITLECIGALYQADNFIKPPGFGFSPYDAGQVIADELNVRIANYGLRLTEMPTNTVWSNTPTTSLGSWNKFLTGWCQELISQAQTPSFFTKNESGCSIVVHENGYWLCGDHGTIISFGDDMPNYGSSTWQNITQVYTNLNKGWYVADVAASPDMKKAWWVNHGGATWSFGGEHVAPFLGAAVSYGDANGQSPQRPFVSIKATASGNGYWLTNSLGQIWSFGDATTFSYSPPSLGSRTASNNGVTYPDLVIDMVPTPSGNGFFLLTWCGYVYGYGDAFVGSTSVPLVDVVFSSMDCTSDGAGLWVLDTYGRVYELGSATDHGDAGASPLGIWADICRSPGGAGWIALKDDGQITCVGDMVNLGNAQFNSTLPSAGGRAIGYTLTKEYPRRPVIRTKNVWATHWTVVAGAPGVKIDFHRDRVGAPNAHFGEGQDVTGQKWRNTKYGNAFPYNFEPPPYPMITIDIYRNNSDAVLNAGGSPVNNAVSEWQNAMKTNGWNLNVDGYYDQYDADICRQMQMMAGLPVTGEVDLQTWTTTFLNSPLNLSTVGNEAYIAPIVVDPRVEPFLYQANGEILGDNPDYDPTMMRRETYINYGERTSKGDAIVSAFAQMKQFTNPGWFGTITLQTDPEEGHRFDIKGGHNIVVKGFNGENLRFHISEVSVSVQDLTATLTVDTNARDRITVAAMIEREITTGEKTLKPTRQFSQSKSTDDKFVAFDADASAGFIPAHAVQGGQWNVVRVPAGEIGTIVRSEFATYPATLYAVGVFDKPVTVEFLNTFTTAVGAEGIMTVGGGEDYGFWEAMQLLYPDAGLMVAWGGQGSLCGTWPQTYEEAEENEFATISGVFKDDSSWNYWSSSPPWLWVAIWSFSSCFINGRFYGGPDGGFNFSDVDTLANPQKTSIKALGSQGVDLTLSEQLQMIKNWTTP